MYGVIDIGSNTMRLNIYDFDQNELSLMLTKKITAGLAGYVNKAGYMTTRGIEKAIESLEEFKSILSQIPVDETFVFATASLRNIRNSKDATKILESRTGIKIDLLSGEDEATLDYEGASMKLELNDGLLVDIGGGSTELVKYKNGVIEHSISMPVGSLNLYTKYVDSFLPTAKEIKKIEKKVLKEIGKLGLEEDDLDTRIICGVGGTVRATGKMINEVYDLPRDNRSTSVDDIEGLLDFYHTNRHDFITTLIKTSPDRLHTILPGMINLITIARYFGGDELHISNYGVREGYLIRKIKERGVEHVR